MATASTSSGDNLVYYKKLVVPVSMRSIYWKYFGFPASDKGEIITRLKIICVLCKSHIAYNKNTSNLRMHLQNKHLAELIKIENQAPADDNKAKVIKKPVKLKQDIQVASEESGSANVNTNEEFYVTEEPGQIFHLDADDEFLYPQTSKKLFPQVAVEDTKSITDAIANFVVADLQAPQVVDGKGFQRLLVTLKSPCEIPSTLKLIYDLIPKMYKNTKENLQAEICNLTSDVGLTLEEWSSSTNNQHYLTISVHYQNSSNTIVCKILSTIQILPVIDANTWEHILESTLSEWNIDYTKVTAVTYATNREEIISAMYNKGYTLIPCFDHTIKECMKLCYESEGIKEIINKVRGIVSTILRSPHASETFLAQETTCQVEGSLQLDNESFWFTTLNMLEQFVAKRDIIENIMQDLIEYPLKMNLEITEVDWLTIQDLIKVSEPFKVTLLTLSEEKVPLISLLKPLLWQVTHNKLKEKDGDSPTLRDLKKIIVHDLSVRYNDDQISPLLQIATMLDPRFKQLPYSSDGEKIATGELIKGMLTKIIQDLGPASEEPVIKKNRLSGMELLLGNYNCKKIKLDPSENANLEYNQFCNGPTPPLYACPVQWWTNNRKKYSNLALLADKYICVPACAILPGKISAENQNMFNLKRSSFTLDPNLLDKILFLHVNQETS